MSNSVCVAKIKGSILRYMVSHIKTALFIVFSTGWILPLGVAGVTLLSFVEDELYPRLIGAPRLNSFPYLDFARNAFIFALIWLGLSVALWSFLFWKSHCRG